MRKGQHCSEETKLKISEAHKGKKRPPFSEEWRKHLSEAHRGKTTWNKGLTKFTDERIARLSQKAGNSQKGNKHWNYGKHWNQEVKQKISRTLIGRESILKGRPFSEEHKRNISKGKMGKQIGENNPFYGRRHSESTKRKMGRTLSRIMKNRYLDLSWVDKWRKSLHLKPNKSEIKLEKTLKEILPDEYKYVGDFSFILGGKNPDFMNVNGQKKLIELYGDYWHNNDDPQERIDFFKQYGFDTLVIWEHELKDIEVLKKNILKFNEVNL